MLKKGLLIGAMLVLVSAPAFAMEYSIFGNAGYASMNFTFTDSKASGLVFTLGGEVTGLGAESLAFAGSYTLSKLGTFEPPAGAPEEMSYSNLELVGKYSVLKTAATVNILAGYDLFSWTTTESGVDGTGQWSGPVLGVEAKGNFSEKMTYAASVAYLPLNGGDYTIGGIAIGTMRDIAGFRVGGGVGYALNDNLALKGNFNYASFTFSDDGSDFATITEILFGADYKF